MSVNSKMTAIADKIRTLLGITGTMGLDSMASNLETAQGEVNTQDALLDQALTAIQNKAAGSGGLPTQEKTVTITSNGTHEILPDSGYVLSKATAIVNVASSGGTSGPYTYAEEFIWTAPADIADGANVTIPHALGAVPDGFNMVALETQFGDTEYIVSNVVFDRAMLYVETFPFIATFGIGDSLGNSSVGFYLDVDGSVVTSDDISFTLSGITAPFCIPAGKQYRILVYKR